MSNEIDLHELPHDRAERWALAAALMARPNLRMVGLEALKQTYPKAPEPILRTAVHHLYGDLPEALVDMLAVTELSLRSPGREVGYGAPYHAIDHLYNFLQFRALLPDGMAGMEALVAQLEELAIDGDLEGIKSTIAELRKRVDGNLTAPDVA